MRYIVGVMPHRFARSLLGSVALGVPFVLVAHVASGFITPLASTAVAALLRVTAPLSPSASDAQPVEEVFDDSPLAEPEVVLAAAHKGPARHGAKPPAKAPPGALFVSKATVLKLSQSAARPHGAFVQQTPEHPAGLRLFGVAALGIGVQDGDILIDALGATPTSPGQVIGAVIAARAKTPRFLSGTLWRRGQSIRITVEQPYEGSSPSLTSVAPPSGDSGDRTTGFAPVSLR
jgi:hypothetical protein